MNLKDWMQRISVKTDKSEAIVSIEPTGHYWLELGSYFENEDIPLVMVNPYVVKQT